jgi:hypothetical protein
MEKQKPPLIERVQRERDRLADRHDPMLKQLNNRGREKEATEIWNRRQVAKRHFSAPEHRHRTIVHGE